MQAIAISMVYPIMLSAKTMKDKKSKVKFIRRTLIVLLLSISYNYIGFTHLASASFGHYIIYNQRC